MYVHFILRATIGYDNRNWDVIEIGIQQMFFNSTYKISCLEAFGIFRDSVVNSCELAVLAIFKDSESHLYSQIARIICKLNQ